MSLVPRENGTARRRIGVWWALALVVSVPLLMLALRGIRWAELLQTVAQTDPAFLGLAVLVFSGSYFLRAERWRIMLTAAAPIAHLTVFWANMAGYLGNSFLPARAGELVRATLVGTRANLSKTFVLAVALTERMCDSLALVLIGAAVLLTRNDVPAWLQRTSRVMGSIGLIGLAVVLLAPHLEVLLTRMWQRLPLPRTLSARLTELTQEFLLGIGTFRHAGRGVTFAGFTVVVWGLDACAAMSVARALNLDVTWTAALILLAALGLSSALPSTPGYVGVYQFVAVTVLQPFGITRTNALAFILMFQAVIYVAVTFWGLLALWRLRQPAATRANAAAVE